MAVMERDVVLMGRDGGRDTMDFPVTRLGNVEGTADVKEAPVGDDYVPVMDSGDGGQMKKTTVAALLGVMDKAEPISIEEIDAIVNA